MRLIIQEDYNKLSLWAARYIANKIIEFKPTSERPFVLGLPTGSTPIGTYKQLIEIHRQGKLSFKNVVTFNMDEYANEKGEIAPETWPMGFMYAFKKFFYSQIDPELRPAENQCQGPTDKNIKDYGKMIADAGNADICYSGPGWTGHLAFI